MKHSSVNLASDPDRSEDGCMPGKGRFSVSEKEISKDLIEGRKGYDEKVAKGLSRQPEMKEVFTTGGGIPLERLYTPLDLENLDYCRDLGFPGSYPFTRGVQPTVPRASTMRQRFCNRCGIQTQGTGTSPSRGRPAFPWLSTFQPR